MLCALMSGVGQAIDRNPRAKEYMNRYFDRIQSLARNTNLSPRLRFMLQVRATL
jgi:translation initiation factor 4G